MCDESSLEDISFKRSRLIQLSPLLVMNQRGQGDKGGGRGQRYL